jgi:hypothetical protein
MDAAKHALDSEEVRFGVRGGASGKKAALPASDLHFKRTGFIESKRQRLARICNCDYHRLKNL